MKERNILRKLILILLIISFILTGIISYFIFKYKILGFRNLNYFLISGLAILLLINLILFIIKKWKIFNFLFVMVFCILLSYATYYLISTINLFSQFNNNARYNDVEISIIVLKDSSIEKIDELTNTKITAPLKIDSTNINKLLENIKNDKNITLTIADSESYLKAFNQLINREVDAIVLNSGYLDLLENTFNGSKDKIKVIYSYKISNEVIVSNHNNQNNAFNIYISGIDTFGSLKSVSRSDVNIIMTINRDNNQILLTTTPRDAYVPIADGGNDQYDKLTHSGLYGINSSIHTLEKLYDIQLPYYIRLNFTSFLKIIDTLGGVDVINDQEFVSVYGGYHFDKGKIHLDSDKALAFVRERKSLESGDFDRGKNQEKVVAAIIEKMSGGSFLNNYMSLMNELLNSVQTNISLETAMDIVNDKFSGDQKYQVKSIALETHGRMGLPSYAMPGHRLYMGEIDEKSLNNVKNQIKSVLNN